MLVIIRRLSMVLGLVALCGAELASAESWNWRPLQQVTPRRQLPSSVRIEALHYGDIPVVGARRKLYRGVPVDRDLAVDNFSVDSSVWSEESRQRTLASLENKPGFERARGVRWELTPALLHTAVTQTVRPVWQAQAVSESIQYLFVDYLDPKTGDLIWRKSFVRNIDAKVYDTSPYNGGSNDAAVATRTLPGLDNSATTLTTSYIQTKRQQSDGSGGFDALDVDPNQDFENALGFSENPSFYNSTCTGSGATSCPNQAFDAVNVFYHVQGYREYLNTLLTQMGETVDWGTEPLMVIANAIAYDVDGDGETTDETNNAFYTSYCTADTYRGGCLLFNPPKSANYSACDGSADFYDLAREALVAVHEYQHYVTDTITGMESGTDAPNVGDLLHEGYSDYFAVSQVTRVSGTPTTTILEYGFQECPVFQRAIGTPKVYDASSSRTDPHYYGWTWASGLYSLRTSLGTSTVDKIALKSLFYLPTNPSFVDAIEALVQADQELNAGANRLAIRTMFYETLRFLGGNTNPFADLGSGVVSVGVTSCLSTTALQSGAGGMLTAMIGMLWLSSLMLGARRVVNKSDKRGAL